MGIRSHEGKAKHAGRRREKTIGRIPMGKRQLLRRDDDFMCQRSLPHVRGCSRNSVVHAAAQMNPPFRVKEQGLPCA